MFWLRNKKKYFFSVTHYPECVIERYCSYFSTKTYVVGIPYTIEPSPCDDSLVYPKQILIGKKIIAKIAYRYNTP